MVHFKSSVVGGDGLGRGGSLFASRQCGDDSPQPPGRLMVEELIQFSPQYLRLPVAMGSSRLLTMARMLSV